MQTPAPDPMTADPNIGAGVGNVAADPNADMPMDDADAMNGADAMEDVPGDDDSTASIIDQLTDDDKEAVRNYAKSLLDRDETQDTAPTDDTAPMPDQSNGGIMMEISKGRLMGVQRKISETFRKNDREKDDVFRKQEKVNKNTGKKSPFDSPLD